MKSALIAIVLMATLTTGMTGCGGTNATPRYTVTYSGNGNTGGGSVPIDSTNYETGQTVMVFDNRGNLANPGYTFSGWKTSATGPATTYTPGQTFTMGAANVTLYANWTVTVTYSGNGNTGGGSVPIDSTNYETGQTVTVLGNTGNLANPGYTFSGWKTSATGPATIYTQGQTFTMGAANVTLYANWTANPTYTVTYSGNGDNGDGSVPIDSTNYEQGQTVKVLGNTGNLANPGYTFSGWKTSATGPATIYTQGQTFTMDAVNVTLYANWTTCTPNCTGKTCGDNECGGSCGSCPGSNQGCFNGACAQCPDADCFSLGNSAPGCSTDGQSINRWCETDIHGCSVIYWEPCAWVGGPGSTCYTYDDGYNSDAPACTCTGSFFDCSTSQIRGCCPPEATCYIESDTMTACL